MQLLVACSNKSENKLAIFYKIEAIRIGKTKKKKWETGIVRIYSP